MVKVSVKSSLVVPVGKATLVGSIWKKKSHIISIVFVRN